MADDISRYEQYSYAANSNLVLQAERSRRRDPRDGTGEVEPLTVSQLKGRMGDRAVGGNQEELAERKIKRQKRLVSRKDEIGDDGEVFTMRLRDGGGGGGADVAATEHDDEEGYRPRLKSSRLAYETILAFVQDKLGYQPRDLLRSAAEEVIAVFKTEKHRDSERKREIESLLGVKVSDSEFSRLASMARQITDFGVDVDARRDDVDDDDKIPAGADVDQLDNERGVAVVFEEEGEDDDSDLDEIVDEGAAELDLEGEEDTRTDLVLEGDPGGGVAGDANSGPPSALGVLDPHDIDGYWLQRQLSKYYDDAVLANRLAEDVLAVLSDDAAGVDERERENRLVELLEYDKFELIKLLLRNRRRIVLCTRYAQAQTPAERARVEGEMKSSAEGLSLLATLQGKGDDVSSARDAPVAAAAAEDGKKSGRTRSGARSARTVPLQRGSVDDAVKASAAAKGDAEPRLLDLDSLAFTQGSHVMSNTKVKLPEGSFFVPKKDYEECHVPAVRMKASTEKLVRVDSMPAWTHSAFSDKMKTLNRMQSRVFEYAFHSDDNMLLCAPTGAGKTNVAVLAILRALDNTRADGGGGGGDVPFELAAFKAVYIAPMKALVAEVVANLGRRFETLGLKVRELTGDINLTRQEIDDTQVIVTTPEKWDIITRKSGERTYTQLVRLLIVDEIHLLHDERGPVLETVVARTTRAVEATALDTRVVGLSATLPNYLDIAAFLRVPLERGVFHFDNSYRPCPLQQQYVGIRTRSPLKRYQLMNEITWEKVREQATGREPSQVIVFVHSRRETGNTARQLRERALEEGVLDEFMTPESASAEIVREEVGTIKSAELAELLRQGFATHHAGMTRADRTSVEELFAQGHIRVLVSTATLAWGVNLPAHAVIIKGTQVYSPEKGRWTELSSMDVMQMMGRAGRPQFDVFGEGIVITTQSELRYYCSLINEQLPIESQLISRLGDSLNAEVALGTVSSVDEAAGWLGHTYLYVRMLRNPTLYGVAVEELESDRTLLQRRRDLAHSAALLLDRTGLVRYERRSGSLQGTDLGRVASYYYVTQRTMATFLEHLTPTLSELDLFRVFSMSGEFESMRVRDEEKLELARLLERVPIPVRDSMDEPVAKVNVLLQAYISNLKLDGLALTADMVYVTQSAGRIARALFEIVLRREYAPLALRCLQLGKMVQWRQWGTQTPLRQFVRALPGGEVLSEDVLRRIERKDMDFESYYDLTAAEIGELLRSAKIGRTVHRLVHYLPRMELRADIQPITRTTLNVQLSLTADFRFDAQVHGSGEAFWIFVEDSDNESILHSEMFFLRASVAEEEHTLSFSVRVAEPLPPQYFIRCVSDRWLAPDTLMPVSFRNLILPSKLPPHTQLLDLQPLGTADAFRPAARGGSEDAEEVDDAAQRRLGEYMSAQFELFNPIQTQAFNAFYRSGANCLLAAPAGAGRLVMAELAVAQLFLRRPTAAAVFVCGAQGELVVPRRVAHFRAGVGEAFQLRVDALSGELAADLKIVDTPGVLAVCTPEQWDQLSRRWKQRRAVRNVALFIIDDVHCLSAAKGAVVEAVCLRMRYIAEQALQAGRRACRLVALSDAVANARDLADWLGVSPANALSFHPSARPVPLETHIQTVGFSGGTAAAVTLARPVYAAIRRYAAANAPAVVFSPSKRLARNIALELRTSAAGDGAARRFLHADAAQLQPFLRKVRVAALRECLEAGIGYLHEAMPDGERRAVEQLFASGAIQVVVATPRAAWLSSALYARLVVVAGTAEEESSSALHRAELPLSEILHIMGRAGRAKEDSSGVCVLLTTPAQREFYRKSLGEPLPVESQLERVIADQLNAEVVARVIESKQDAVDYLTWTLYYRRLAQNPNYYNMLGSSHRHVSDHLSQLVEDALEVLEKSRCVAAEGEQDMELGPLNFGMIASYYYIRCSSVELFASSVTPRTRTRGVLEVLTAAQEYDDVAVRVGDDAALRRVAAHVPVALAAAGSAADGGAGAAVRYADPHVKTHLLLQAHFSRLPLGGELREDAERVLGDALRLVHAVVDVVSSVGWLKPALAAMETSQMIVQGMWERDPPLLQLPHVDRAKAEALGKLGVESVFDLLEMDDDARVEALAVTPAQLADIAEACNRYPDVDMEFELPNGSDVRAGEQMEVTVQLTREGDDDEGADPKAIPVAHTPLYVKRKEEGWWLVLGNVEQNMLLAVKRVWLGRSSTVKLAFTAPEGGEPRQHTLKLYLMSDCYLGCDLEKEFTLNVGEALQEDDDDKEEDADAAES